MALAGHAPVSDWAVVIQQTVLACHTASILVQDGPGVPTGAANLTLVLLAKLVATILQPQLFRLPGPVELLLQLGLHSFACLMSCLVEVSVHACSTHCISEVARSASGSQRADRICLRHVCRDSPTINTKAPTTSSGCLSRQVDTWMPPPLQ